MKNTTHGADGRWIRTAEQAEKDAEACRLRSRGLSYAQIAKQAGYSDHTAARRAVERALAEIVTEPAAEVRQLELLKLDAMERAALEVLERHHVTVSNGRVVVDLDSGKPLADDAPVLAAIDRLLKIGERRAKLLGLDAPKRLEVVTLDWIDEQIAQLTADIQRQAAELGGAAAAEDGAAEGAAPA